MAFDRSLVDKMPDPSLDADRMSALLGEAKLEFAKWARDALRGAHAELEALGDAEHAAEAKAAIFGVFHDLKGSAGGVGYDLLSKIGESCCGYVRAASLPDRQAAKIVRAHIVAAEGVLAAGVEGDGGAVGAAMLQKLRAATIAK